MKEEPRANMEESYYLFSSGTEFMDWYEHNCSQCVKAVFYNEKKQTYPKYKCAIQKHIEEACIGNGKGDKRTYDTCRSFDCPYKQTERKKYTKRKKDKSLTLNFEE